MARFESNNSGDTEQVAAWLNISVVDTEGNPHRMHSAKIALMASNELHAMLIAKHAEDNEVTLNITGKINLNNTDKAKAALKGVKF